MKSLLRHITDDLSVVYERGEARAVSLMLMSFIWPEKTDVQLLLIDDDDTAYSKARPYIQRLTSNEPIQYVIGKVDFRGLEIHVEPGVLIPRPETELLISLISNQLDGDDGFRFLDIGTGSGCIALSLKSEYPECTVEAWDISPVALSVASANAHRLHLNIEFRQVDILNHSDTDDFNRKYDLIVSNPPYITEAEKAGMDVNVLDFEPAAALFVPDSDPLLFYRKIAMTSRHLLKEGGIIALEINPRFVSDLRRMLSEFGFSNVTPHKDQFEKDRFITAVWKK